MPKIIFQDETEANSYNTAQDRRVPRPVTQWQHDSAPQHCSQPYDLSRSELQEIPDSIFDNYEYVTIIYLEGNLLKELPDKFFTSLPFLKWLDVRRNSLTEIPTSVAHHQHLEVLLLQENKIRKLPLELGLVPKLRGVQFLGNPIEFPPADILKEGVERILQFLREEWNIQCPSNIRPIEEPFYKKPLPKESKAKDLRKMVSKSGMIRSVTQNSSNLLRRREKSLPELSVISYKPQMRRQPHSAPHLMLSSEGTKTSERDVQAERELQNSSQNTECPRYKCAPKHHQYVLDTEEKPSAFKRQKSPSDLSKRSVSEGKIYDNLLKELWLSKIKSMLEQQADIIQKRKDVETLKAWRKNMARLVQMRSLGESMKHDMSIPYDVDEDYMTMLSRHDINDPSLRTGKQKLPAKKKPTRTVAEEMSEVFSALQKLHENRTNTSLSPRSEQEILSVEIETLANLQKRLQALKFRNAKNDLVFLPEKMQPILVRGIGKSNVSPDQ